MCNGVKQDGWDNPTFHSPSQKYIPDLDGANNGNLLLILVDFRKQYNIQFIVSTMVPLDANCRYMHGPFRGTQDMTQHTYYPDGPCFIICLQ